MTSFSALRLERSAGVLHVTLNQAATRNALTGQMIAELRRVAADSVHDGELRCLVLRGAGGNFCAGGHFSDFQAMMLSAPPTDGPDPIAVANREFGRMLQEWQALPQTLVAVVEGAAMGGGFGLASIADIVLAGHDAQFAMPETSLGLPPAQIAPFVAQRIGLAQTRRLALTAARLNASQAQAIGLVDALAEGSDALAELLQKTQHAVLRCAPRASASTKMILERCAASALDATLDFAAQEFARALRNGDALEGVRAFAEKRPAAWARME